MTDESESRFPEVMRFREAWKSAPPAPGLSPFILPDIRADSPRLVALIEVDVLERRRRQLPCSPAHYRDVLGDLAGPGTPVARRLIMLERIFGADAGELADRLGPEYAEDLAAIEEELANAPTVTRPPTEWIDASSNEAGRRSSQPDPMIGRTVGHYHITGVIGRGGMGVVYEARQEQPSRLVALKVINPGVTTEEMLRRFEHEAEILGRLQHPGIAHIYEAGTFDLGAGPQPFFAMEYIRGEPLTKYADRVGLGTRDRLSLMVKVCEAVEHAHQKFVIHRDLKPGNILVTEAGEPKVLDFGVARATDSDIQTTTMRTDIGQLIGTIPYMSPEQAGGDPDDLDTRSDVYALGVVCYELLAGRLPYNLARKMVHEAVRIIREDDPTPLSTVNRTLRGDVEIIVGRALEKEKDRRFQSAQEFSEEIGRYLNNLPIKSRSPSAAYRVRKFTRRNKVLVGGVAATFIALVAGLITSLILLGEANAAWEAEAQRADELEKVSEFQASQLSGIETEVMGIRLRRDILDQRQAVLQSRGMEDPEIEAAMKELESSLGGVNFTNVALNSLETNIFDRALKAIDEQFADQPLVKARLLQTVADTQRELGLLDAATAPQEDALEIRRRVLRDEHPHTLHSISSMGALLRAQGKLTEAAPYYHESLNTARRVLGDAHPHTLLLVNNMGLLYQVQGHLADAERHYREALAGFRRVLGNEHPHALLSIGNMGFLLEEQGKYTEAESYYREALEIRRRVLGSDHPETLISINNMAGVRLQAKGTFAEAEPYFHEALEGFRRVLGDEHPNTLSAVNNMGELLKAQGRFAEAEPYLREALETGRRVLGDEHPTVLITINNMGQLLRAQGKYDEAEPYHREALETSRRVLGKDHVNTLTAINNMGLLFEAQGRYAEAEANYREALDGLRRVLGSEHHITLICISNIGVVLRAQGKLAEAAPYYGEALAAMRRVLGDGHLDTLISISNMSALLRELGQFVEAEQLGREAVGTARSVFSPGYWYTGGFLSQYARTLAAMQRFTDSEEYALEAHAILEAALGPTHERTIGVVKQLAELYDAWHASEPDNGYDAKAAQWRARLAELQPAESSDGQNGEEQDTGSGGEGDGGG